MEAITRRTGLTDEQIELLLRCFNGIIVPAPHVQEQKLGGTILGKEFLLSTVRGEAGNAHDEVNTRRTWLETLDGNAEAPFLIEDLIERLGELSEAQAESLLYFIEGYYSNPLD